MNSLDLIDLMGPDATREDYLHLDDLVHGILDDPEFFEGDESPIVV